MIKKTFLRKNFLAILAFGVMFMAVFVATNFVGQPTQTVSRAQGLGR